MKNFFKAVVTGAVLCAVTASITGCNWLGIDRVYVDKWAGLVNEKSYTPSVSGNTITYGEHSYTIVGEVDYEGIIGSSSPTASVTFTNIPSGFTEFKAVYEGLLGKSLAGTAAMVPMAMEIYARNMNTGERCLNLLCKDEVAVNDIIRVFKTKIVPSSAAGADDPYLQRYLPAALLKGANYENAYAPIEPYTVEIGPSSNKYREVKMAPYGTVYYTYIFADGWDTRARGVELFLPKAETLYKLQSCSSCYTQCKTIFGGPWQGLK